MVPRMIFVHRGIFRFEHVSAVDPSAAPLIPGTPVAMARSSRSNQFQLAVVVTASDSLGFCVDMRRHMTATYEVQLDDGRIVAATAQDLWHVDTRRLVESDEQLALLLSHELSHVIHGHVEEAAFARGIAAGTNLLVIALLNLRGLTPFCVEAVSGAVTYGFVLKGKRSHEIEADATGLRLVARAGYNPQHAAAFLERVLSLEESGKLGSCRPSWRSDHPSTMDRIQCLRREEVDVASLYEEALAREAAAIVVSNAHCASHDDRHAQGRRSMLRWPSRRVEHAATLS